MWLVAAVFTFQTRFCYHLNLTFEARVFIFYSNISHFFICTLAAVPFSGIQIGVFAPVGFSSLTQPPLFTAPSCSQDVASDLKLASTCNSCRIGLQNRGELLFQGFAASGGGSADALQLPFYSRGEEATLSCSCCAAGGCSSSLRSSV